MLGNMNLPGAVHFPEINVSLIPNTLRSLPKSRQGSLKHLLILKKIGTMIGHGIEIYTLDTF